MRELTLFKIAKIWRKNLALLFLLSKFLTSFKSPCHATAVTTRPNVANTSVGTDYFSFNT